ncbi:MAG: hypothetical protein IPL39_12360 [Opitutaceae bacterium]|nr:hypothetical protein [Opitutaceae bacterium]
MKALVLALLLPLSVFAEKLGPPSLAPTQDEVQGRFDSVVAAADRVEFSPVAGSGKIGRAVLVIRKKEEIAGLSDAFRFQIADPRKGYVGGSYGTFDIVVIAGDEVLLRARLFGDDSIASGSLHEHSQITLAKNPLASLYSRLTRLAEEEEKNRWRTRQQRQRR